MHCSTDYVVVYWILSDLCVKVKCVCDAWWREQSEGVALRSAGVDLLVYSDIFYTYMLFLCCFCIFVSLKSTVDK